MWLRTREEESLDTGPIVINSNHIVSWVYPLGMVTVTMITGQNYHLTAASGKFFLQQIGKAIG